MPLLEVSGLTITLQTPRGRARAVQNLEFILERGATLGLIGESGCGKSLTALALIDRKSTRLNSSHLVISYAVFCLKKKKVSPPPGGAARASGAQSAPCRPRPPTS